MGDFYGLVRQWWWLLPLLLLCCERLWPSYSSGHLRAWMPSNCWSVDVRCVPITEEDDEDKNHAYVVQKLNSYTIPPLQLGSSNVLAQLFSAWSVPLYTIASAALHGNTNIANIFILRLLDVDVLVLLSRILRGCLKATDLMRECSRLHFWWWVSLHNFFFNIKYLPCYYILFIEVAFCTYWKAIWYHITHSLSWRGNLKNKW